MNIIKSIKNYFFYRKIVNRLKPELLKNFGIKVDLLSRLYTVYTIDEKDFLEYKSYQEHSEKLIDTEFKGYKKKLDNYLMKQGLTEMYGIYIEDRVNDRQFKLGITYKYLDVLSIANALLILIVSILIGASMGLILLLFV
jgi:hypothetical protein